MRVRIILHTSTTGLRADANIFKKEIDKTGSTCLISNQFDNLPNDKDDIHLYIQDFNKRWCSKAKIRILMVNHEFFTLNHYKKPYCKLDYCFCRTQAGVDWVTKVKKKYNYRFKIVLTKFTTNFPKIDVEDKYYNLILHSAGEHHWKQTDSIVKCWLANPDLPLIIITCVGQCYKNIKNLLKDKNPNNLYIVNGLIPKNDFIWLKNSCMFHLCPSIVEGYGHYINEGRKLGAFVVTSNIAPMNELIDNNSGMLIDCTSYAKKRNGVPLCEINEAKMYEEVKKALSISIEERKRFGEEAIKKFNKDKDHFQKTIKEFFKKLK